MFSGSNASLVEPTRSRASSTDAASEVPDNTESALSLARVWRVVQRRRRPFLIVAVLISGISFTRAVIQEVFEPTYEGSFTLLISDPVNTQANRGGQGGGGAIESLARNSTSVDVPTLIQVLQSTTVLDPVYTKLQQEGFKDSPKLSVQLVQANSASGGSIGTVVASGVLQVSAKGKDQQAVTRLLNLTEKATIDWSLSQKRLQLSEGVRYLDQQAPQLQQRNAALQQELSRFRQSNNTLDPEAEARAISQQMAELESQMLQLTSSRRELLDIHREIASGRLTARSFNLVSGSGGGGSGSGPGGSGLAAGLPSQGLLDEWQRLENAIGSARGSYRADSPVLRGLIASQNRLRPALQKRQLEAVQAALRQNSDRGKIIQGQFKRLEMRFKRQPELLNKYQALQQRISIAATNLSDYLKTRDQFQLEIAQNTSPWQIITPTSVRRSGAGTGLSRGFIQSLLMGMIGGVTVAIIRDRFDHVYHAPDEVEKELKLPLLGHVPYVKAFENIRRDKALMTTLLEPDTTDAIGRYQRFYYQEALRNLYTSLRFLDAGTKLRSIAITSTQPSEGKSLVNILLAKTIAELGLRVLMVDADLRKPQLHIRLGLDNLIGLSNLITDPEGGWQQAVQKVEEVQGIDVITAGRTVPNPPKLLSSRTMRELVESIATSNLYDIVIYDAPPLLGLADAPLLANQLDGLVLLVSLNRVDRGLPLDAVKRLRASGANVLGLVTNSMRPKGETGDAYAYSYGRAQMDPYSMQTYGALDPSASYAYYQAFQSDESKSQRKATTETKKVKEPTVEAPANPLMRRLGESLQAFSKRLMRWLDG